MSEVDTFRDDASRQKKPLFDWKLFGIAVGAMVVIFGVIIGVLVTQLGSLDTSDPLPVNTTNANNTTAGNTTTGGSSTQVDLTCATMMKDFATKSLVLTMSVSSSISAVEIEYAANVFEKTYGAMLANELAEAQANYCDPYCRKITAVNVDSNSLTSSDAATAEARQASTCDSSLQLTFSVEGTYYGCEETVFPGLFAPDGRRQLKRNLRSVASIRTLEEEDTCPVCPDEVTSLGLVSPSTAQLKETMKDFVTVLPAICELTNAEIIEN